MQLNKFNNVIRLFPKNYSYLKDLGKIELLEEMMRFQEDRSRTGYLSRDLIQKGLILFQELKNKANTPELRMLCNSYLKNLNTEKEKLNAGDGVGVTHSLRNWKKQGELK